MAKITFDPLVQNVSRGLGNFVYSSCNGKAYIRMRPKKPIRVTPVQQKHRDSFAAAGSSWSILSGKVKESWEALRKGSDLSAYNLFIAENVDRFRKEGRLNLTHGNGLAVPADLKAESLSAGEITVSFTQTAEPLCLTVIIQQTDEKGKILFSEAAADSVSASTVIRDLPAGSEITAYCIFSDKPMAEADRISASSWFKVPVK